MNPPPIIIIIKNPEPSFVFFPRPAMAKVKIQGHKVEQNNPTEIKA